MSDSDLITVEFGTGANSNVQLIKYLGVPIQLIAKVGTFSYFNCTADGWYMSTYVAQNPVRVFADETKLRQEYEKFKRIRTNMHRMGISTTGYHGIVVTGKHSKLSRADIKFLVESYGSRISDSGEVLFNFSPPDKDASSKLRRHSGQVYNETKFNEIFEI